MPHTQCINPACIDIKPNHADATCRTLLRAEGLRSRDRSRQWFSHGWSFPGILPIPVHKFSNAVAEICLRPIPRQGFQQIRIRPSCRHVACLHAHVIPLSLLAETVLDRVHEVQQTHLVRIADIHDAVGGHG